MLRFASRQQFEDEDAFLIPLTSVLFFLLILLIVLFSFFVSNHLQSFGRTDFREASAYKDYTFFVYLMVRSSYKNKIVSEDKKTGSVF